MRAKLTRLAARRTQHEPSDALRSLLLERLVDTDERTRRAAASGLGRVGDAEMTEAIAERCLVEQSAVVLGELVTALGKIGGPRAAASLAEIRGRKERIDDEAFRDALERATLMCGRSDRGAIGKARIDDAPDAPLAIAMHCRPGLEPVLYEELESRLGDVGTVVATDGAVELSWSGPPRQLLRCRVMTELGVVVRAPKTGGPADAAAFAELIAGERVWPLLRRCTDGEVRYRLAWLRGGKRRKLRWDVIALASRLRPELQNDPSQSPWEIRLGESRRELVAELVPQLDDPRFGYRKRDVPAASHPTVAAALVRIAEVGPEDVVWDPFVGSGLELCEAWLAAHPKALVGSDRDPDALTAARANLRSVGAKRVRLERADALTLDDVHPTCIVTNPPLGRRVLRGQDVEGTLVAFVRRAARRLPPGGRLIWVSPHPDATRLAARDAGLEVTRELSVDLGGLEGTIQRFDRRGSPQVTSAEGSRGRSPRTAGSAARGSARRRR